MKTRMEIEMKRKSTAKTKLDRPRPCRHPALTTSRGYKLAPFYQLWLVVGLRGTSSSTKCYLLYYVARLELDKHKQSIDALNLHRSHRSTRYFSTLSPPFHYSAVGAGWPKPCRSAPLRSDVAKASRSSRCLAALSWSRFWRHTRRDRLRQLPPATRKTIPSTE
jgi:hypothetical protein